MNSPRVLPESRFWSKVEFTGFCWLWSAALDGSGYGNFAVKPKVVGAHRWAYEHLVGPIPVGLELDHLCRIHSCVNPDHLEPVTKAENKRRGIQGSLRTRCLRGHLMTPDNIYTPPSRPQVRSCRTCRKDRRGWYKSPTPSPLLQATGEAV